MNDDFRIRSATPSDVALILRLIRALAIYEKMEDQVVATEELLNEWIFEKQIAKVLIAEVDGIPVGFALWFHNFSTFLGRGGIWLEDLFVEPEYRGKGIATQLLNQVCSNAYAEGYEYVEAYPSDQVQNSLAFTGPVRLYEKSGFTEFSRIGSTIVMRKKLR